MPQDDNRLEVLADLMDRFARTHWNDRFRPGRAGLSIEAGRPACTVADDTFVGDASTPLIFVSGAWALIFAHETGGAFGHRMGGALNRIWPHGVDTRPTEHGFGDAVATWSRLWPGLLFSSELYDGVATPGHPHHPRSAEDAPKSTSLSGVMKRVVKTASDPDPLERLKVAEFVLFNLSQWSYTAEDLMMGSIGKPLLALSRDDEPAIREVALLALDMCAFRCWYARAYGLYEPLSRRLVEAGLNAHLNNARLAESAYAGGDLAEGDKLWALASEGIALGKTVRLSEGYDDVGLWPDLRIRILRQAGGANINWMRGLESNPARRARQEKKGVVAPTPEAAAAFLETARALVSRAADFAEREPSGEPSQRRTILSEIAFLQSNIAAAEGDGEAELRFLFRAMTIDWEREGRPERFESRYDELAIERIGERDLAALAQLEMPAFFARQVAQQRAGEALAESPAGRDLLSWQRFFRQVLERMLSSDTTRSFERIAGEDLTKGLVVEENGETLTVSHEDLSAPVTGTLAEPVTLGLRFWNALVGAGNRGDGVAIEGSSTSSIHLSAEDLSLWSRMAGDAWSAGRETDALMLYRIACGHDPLIRPWPYRDPVTPLALDAVPAALREAVAATSPLEEHEGFAKMKPRGKRAEQLVAAYDAADIVTTRLIANLLREPCAAGESEIVRVVKSAAPFLLRLLAHPSPWVRDAALPPAVSLLTGVKWHAPALDVGALREAVVARDVVDLRTIARA